MRKKILSLLLCIVMCLSLLPTVALATEPNNILEYKLVHCSVEINKAAASEGETFMVTVTPDVGYELIPDDYYIFARFENEDYNEEDFGADSHDGNVYTFTMPKVPAGETVKIFACCTPAAPAPTEITGVTVSNVQAPVLGDPCSTSGITVTTAPIADALKISYPRWAKKVTDDEVWHIRLYDEPYKNMSESDTFEEGTYRLILEVGIKDEYSFSAGYETTINGETATSYRTDSDQFISIWSKEYSVTAPAAPTAITEVSIEGLKVPEVGTTLSEFLSTVKVPADADYSIMDYACFIKGSDTRMAASQKFEAGVEYYFGAVLLPNSGYMFSESTAVTTADIAKGGHSVEANAEMGGTTLLTVETAAFTPAASTAPIAITEVILTGYESPVVGQTAGNQSNLVVPSDAGYEIDWSDTTSLWWNEDAGYMSAEDTFVEGKSYSAVAFLKAKAGYYFDENCTFVVKDSDDNPVELWEEMTMVFYTKQRASATTKPVLADPTAPEPVPTYTIIAGANGEWTKGSTDGLIFVSDAPMDKFSIVKVDGAMLGDTFFAVESGSTKVTLAPAYLETMSEGVHSIEIVSIDGSASTTFTVKAAPTPTEITAVTITGLEVPEVGTTLSEFLSTVKVPTDADYSIMDFSCFIKGSDARMTPGQAFEAGVEYYFGAVIYPDAGYKITASTDVSTADIAKGSQTVEANAEMGGMTVLTVETVGFTPTEPAACEVASIDLTVDEPALGMTHLQMFESLSLIAYDKDGNVVEHIGIDGYDAFSYATFALSAMDHWDDAIADASKYYGLAPYIGTDAGVTIAKDVQVTVNGSSSSILEVNIWDDESQNVVVNFAMPVKAAPSYSIIAGANGEWTKGDMSAYLVVSDAPFAKFKNVKVDGAVIADTNYVAFEGSTKVTLAPEYLETLSEGVHSIEIVSSDGSASTNFTVKVAPVTTGTITISKTFMDIDEDDCPINTATFTVTSNDGTYYKTAKVGDREFAPNPAAGQFVWELNDVPAGTYTVTETAYNVDGYTCTVTYKVGTGDEQEGDSATAALAAGEDLVFTFVDTYVKDVTVTFEMNGHGTQVPAQTFASGEKAAKPADPAASGYTFDGWYADAAFSAAFDFNTAINADTTVYAKWTEKTPPSDPSSPQTGDNSHLFLWAALLFISGGALAVTSVYDKKRRSIVK